MPTPRQSPTNQDPTHDVVMSWEGNKRGFMFRKNAVSLTESPIHAPTRFWTAEQRSWLSGGGRLSYSQEPSGFFDSQDLWTMTDGAMFPSLQWHWAKGIRSADFHAPGAVTFKALVGAGTNDVRVATKLTASASYTAAMYSVLVRKVGHPANGYLWLCADSGGNPVTATQLQASTITESTDVTDTISRWLRKTCSDALTSGTDYWVLIGAEQTDTEANHWEVGVDTTGTASKISTNESTWAAAGYTMYYRVTDADINRLFWEFVLEGATYIVDKKEDRTASQVWINGDRGTATSATGTTIVDSGKSWTADRWIGAYVRIFSGTGDGQVRVITDNDGTSLTVATWDKTPDSTSRYIIYNTDWWTECATTGLGAVTGRPAVVNTFAYFPQGATAVRRMKVNGSSYTYAADGTNTFDLMGGYLSGGKWYLAGIKNSTSRLYTAVAATTWANSTFTAGAFIGGTDYNATNIRSEDGVLYVWKEDGCYKVSGNVVVKVATGFDALPDSNTGVALCFKDQMMYASYAGSITETQGSTTTDMFNYKFGYEGLPDNRRGKCSALLSAAAWLFAGIDAGSSNWSSVLAHNGIGWHELMRGYTTGARVRNIFWQSCPDINSRLWVSINGELTYIAFPHNAAAPLRDSGCTFQHEGVFVSSTIDMNERALYKFASVLRAVSENLGNGPIKVDYQLDNDIGSSTWYPASSFFANSPSDTVSMNLGGIFQIRLRFRIQSKSATTPPVLRSFSLEGNLKAQEKYQWAVVFDFGTDVEDLQGNETKPTEDLAWLRERARRADKLTIASTDKAINGKIVVLESPSRQAEYTDEPGEWFGPVWVTMREA